MQQNLRDYISYGNLLSLDRKVHIYNLLSHGRHAHTNNKLYSLIMYAPSSLWNYDHPLLARFLMDDGETVFDYCAGQDYTAEMNKVVDLLLRR